MILIALLLIGYIVVLKLPQASVISKSAVAEISAEELYLAFTEDEAKAQKDYLGKAVVVQGKLDEKYEDENGAPVVILAGADGSPVSLITLEQGESQKLNRYDVGKDIRIKALCSGLLMEVTLNKGIILGD